VYPAGEAPIVGADGRTLARSLRAGGKVEPIFVETIAEMPDAIRQVARDGDVVLTMGAGSISGVPGQLTAHAISQATAHATAQPHLQKVSS
jgi:UDP-N-acetylmuramate--alanine ligase